MASNVCQALLSGLGRIHCSPFSDDTLWQEISDKAHFWRSNDFYGVDMTPLHEDALKAYFRQCTVDAFDPVGGY